MAVLNIEFIGFHKKIKLTDARIKDLKKSRNEIKKKIRKWFKEEKEKDKLGMECFHKQLLILHKGSLCLRCLQGESCEWFYLCISGAKILTNRLF